jgi:2-dehydro-3-deoxygluconokinase
MAVSDAADAAHWPSIVTLGEPLIEFNQTDPATAAYLQGFGGDTSNTAIAAARQGARVGVITRVGADTFGDLFIDLWQREGVDVRGVARDATAHTGVYFVSHTSTGHAFSYLRAGSAASRMTPADLPRELITHAQWLHVSGISQAISASACDAVFAAIAMARETGVRVSYDSNLRLRLWPVDRARAVVRATAALADVFLPSLDDVTALSGLSDPEAALQWCLDTGASTIVLKLGSEGVIASIHGQRLRLPAHAVDAVDATGAGDCFAGAMLACLCAGHALPEALRYANVAAGLMTAGFGAVAPIPRRAQVEQLLKRSS